jgi:hypothetical protein
LTYRFITFAAACLIAAVSLGSAHAVPILDQQNVVSSNVLASVGDQFAGGPTAEVAQIFTVGVTGTLSKVGLQIEELRASSVNLIVRILSVTGGLPDPTSALSTATLTPDMVPSNGSSGLPMTTVSLGTGIAVTAGDVFAIALSAPGESLHTYGWFMDQVSDSYPGGDLYARYITDPSSPFFEWQVGTRTDAGFQTFVEPETTIPEPGILALFAPALLIGGIARARMKRHETLRKSMMHPALTT